jgi:hypothetical protein
MHTKAAEKGSALKPLVRNNKIKGICSGAPAADKFCLMQKALLA